MKKIFTIIATFITTFAYSQSICVPNTNSLNFNGTSNYVSFPANSVLDISAAITVEAWIFPTQFGATSAQNSIACKHGWSSGEEGFVLRCGGNGIADFNIAGVDTNGIAVSWKFVGSPVGTLPLNTWTHVAGTYDGFNLNLYVNGSPVGTTPFIGSILPSVDYNFKIGKIADDLQTLGRYFSGMIDEVRVYNRALSQTEIIVGMVHHIDPSTQTGLVGYWRLNEGSGTTAIDSSANNITGTLVGATWSTQIPFNDAANAALVSYNGTDLISSIELTYQWYLNGNLIPGATSQTYAPTQNGTYTVEITNVWGCPAMSLPYTLTSVGANEIISSAEIILTPNPFSSTATLIVNGNSPLLNCEMEIYDVLGEKIKHIFITQKKTIIDRENLESGMYFYKIETGKEIIVTGKMIVED